MAEKPNPHPTPTRVEDALIGAKYVNALQHKVRHTHVQKFIAARGDRENRVKLLKAYFYWYGHNVMGYNKDQIKMINRIWASESGWDWEAQNPNPVMVNGEKRYAYGIPQSVAKVHEKNPFRQIEQGFGYINKRYSNGDWTQAAKNALDHKIKYGWY